MPKLKPGTILPTPTHDKAITRAARSDPDAKPLTEREWKLAKPHVRVGRPPKADAKVAVKLPGCEEPARLGLAQAQGKANDPGRHC